MKTRTYILSLLLLAFDIPVSPAVALFVTMLPLLASAFPITPSGAGVVEIPSGAFPVRGRVGTDGRFR